MIETRQMNSPWATTVPITNAQLLLEVLPLFRPQAQGAEEALCRKSPGVWSTRTPGLV